MSTPRLRLTHISRAFGVGPDGAAAGGVREVSLDVAAGEVACLLGPSGCGKSTTLRIAAGVERADAGEVWIDGVQVSGGRRDTPPEKRPVGLMFQDLALFPHLSVLDNVAFGLKGADRRARAAAELERVTLAHRADAYPHELSGGEQQRVALARALAPRPSVLLMDEPFSSVDHRLRDEIREESLTLLRELGAAVLVVTHDPEEAMRMADRIALMRDGRIVQSGSPFELYYNPVDRRAAAFFSHLNVVHSVVAHQRAETPFGVFAANGLADGADVELIVRPQHLGIRTAGAPAPSDQAPHTRAASATVERVRFVGAASLIDVRLEDGRVLQAAPSGAVLPPVGAPVEVNLRRDACFLFPCTVQSRLASPYLAAEMGGDSVHGVAPVGDARARPLSGVFDLDRSTPTANSVAL